MDQPYPTGGQPAQPLRPAAPAPVRTAVRLMYAGAAVSTVTLIISLALIPAVKAALRTAHPGLTAAQARDVAALITLAMLVGLAVVAGWLWMARATSQGRNWARILSTALFGLATLELMRRPQYPGAYLAHFVIGGQLYPVIHSVVGAAVLGLLVPVLLWLTGLASVWLLWRPASSAFFRSCRQAALTGQPSVPKPGRRRRARTPSSRPWADCDVSGCPRRNPPAHALLNRQPSDPAGGRKRPTLLTCALSCPSLSVADRWGPPRPGARDLGVVSALC